MPGPAYEPLQPLPPIAGTVDRRAFLVEQARGRRVVHLGCVDDRLTRERLAAGLLLHDQLGRVAASLVGVDISEAGIELLRSDLPGTYVVGDVEDLRAIDLPRDVEVIIASELIEHLANPGRFLEGLRSLLVDTGASAVLTTPNAYGWVGFAKVAVRRREPSHPDHVLLYSPFTLVATLERAGLTVDALHMHDWARGAGLGARVRSAVAAVVRRWNPYLGVGLIACVSAPSTEGHTATADTR